MEKKEHSKEDYYLAQIAAEVRRGIVKNPNKVKLKDFLLTIQTGPVSNPDTLENSKSFWLSSLGVGSKSPGAGRQAGRKQNSKGLG